jgi:hypothetical protein
MKKLVLISMILILLVMVFSLSTLSSILKKEKAIVESFEKISEQVIADGAKFKAQMIVPPVRNTEIPIQFEIINGVIPPDPQICVLNITINEEAVFSNRTCIDENETLNLVFDYEIKEDEEIWNISIFYSVNDSIKNVSMFLRKRPAEEGRKINLIITLPEKVKGGGILEGSATFTSDSENWIEVEKVVLIIKKEDTYYKFEKILDYPIPPKFHYTTDYKTTLPENIQTGDYIIQGILYYIEGETRKAVSYSRNIKIV